MAHFARIDTNNIVTDVVVVSDTDAVSGQAYLNNLGLSGTWLQTSYNSSAGKHHRTFTKTIPLTGMGIVTYTDISGVSATIDSLTTPINDTRSSAFSADNKPHFRYNFAGIGYSYDATRDAFIPPKPSFPSWVLNETTCAWVSPVPYPTDGNRYKWDESTTQWVLVSVHKPRIN
jgi:hypothetical protein